MDISWNNAQKCKPFDATLAPTITNNSEFMN